MNNNKNRQSGGDIASGKNTERSRVGSTRSAYAEARERLSRRQQNDAAMQNMSNGGRNTVGGVPASSERTEKRQQDTSRRSDTKRTGASTASGGTSPRRTASRRAGRNTVYTSAKRMSAHPTPRRTPTESKKRARDYVASGDLIRVKGVVDRPALILIILLVCLGTIMIFSASYAYAYQKYNDSFHFIKRQLMYIGIGAVVMAVAVYFDYMWIKKLTLPVFVMVTGLMVLVPIIGIAEGNATRWIKIGPITIQPSEFLKLALILFLALYFEHFKDKIINGNFWTASVYGVLMPIIVVGFECILVALESHFSGVIIIFCIGAAVIFVAGAMMRWLIGFASAASLLVLAGIMLTSYASNRIDMWLNPENFSSNSEIMQTLQGLNAVGSGGIFGVGFGNSTQKHMFVSQPQNDFIFAIACEELGLVGASTIILLFILLVWRGIHIARNAPDVYSSLIAFGITFKLALQSILNMCVVTNMIPNTGISLPFFSYGGTAFIMLIGEMGILLSISRYSLSSREVTAQTPANVRGSKNTGTQYSAQFTAAGE